jgi:cellulose synthase/poly-beta-1,6-N-acetylglucosamine synthase-like glycosyltransferase
MSLIGLFLISFIGIYLNVWFLLLFLENKNFLFKTKKPKRYPKISILIPAHNEEKNIGKTLKSVLSIDYPKKKLEVIVIDNASKDKTSEVVKKFKKVKLIKIPVAGKAIALNEGLKVATGEIIGILDADSQVSKSCLKRMIGYFDDKRVGGVTNFIKVDEKKKILSKLQDIEYLISGLTKRLLSFLETFFILPGTLSLIRADLARKIKFSPDTLTEDMDIALEIIKRGYKIENCLDSISYTEIPKRLRSWFRQRIRWYRGFIQNTIKHKDILFRKKFLNLGWFVIPIAGYFAILIGVYVILLNSLDLIYNFFLTLRSINFIPIRDQINLALANFPNLSSFLFYPYSFIISLIIFFTSFFIFFIGLKVLRKIDLKTVILLPFYMTFYYTLVMVSWLISLFLELIGWKKEW